VKIRCNKQNDLRIEDDGRDIRAVSSESRCRIRLVFCEFLNETVTGCSTIVYVDPSDNERLVGCLTIGIEDFLAEPSVCRLPKRRY
jgi:hypothetical protein